MREKLKSKSEPDLLTINDMVNKDSSKITRYSFDKMLREYNKKYNKVDYNVQPSCNDVTITFTEPKKTYFPETVRWLITDQTLAVSTRMFLAQRS